MKEYLKYHFLRVTKLILAFSLIILSQHSNSQSLSNLENQKKDKLKEIEYTNQLLKQTKEEKKNSYSQVILINKQINSRKDLITNIESEISGIDNKISANNQSIISLESKLKTLKDEYAKLIYFAYKNHSPYNKLLYIFSSRDFNTAYKRIKYLQQYTQYRQKQAQLIINTKDSINNFLSNLQQKKSKKINLVNDHKSQTFILSNEKTIQNNIYSNLKSKEKDLKKKLLDQQIEAQQMQKAIESVIADEARKASERAKIESELKARENENKKIKNRKHINDSPEIVNDNSKNSKTNETRNEVKNENSGYGLTSEDQLISDNFGQNQGKLPWPTSRGVITETFGEHEDPVLKGVKTMNNGISITTNEGSKARTIFDGTVSKVFPVPGKNKGIIVRHGDYYTVYVNLSEVTVNAGDKVKTKQEIGTIYTNEDGKTSIDLQIWRGEKKLNPSLWLSH